MSFVIAIAGKGGTGKTTTAALLVRLLTEAKKGSVLAVDADPNSNLAEALGVETRATIGSILDEIAANPDSMPSGMTKERFIEYQVQSAILEAEGFDILAMGKPEGPGCYCYVNNVLRNVLAKLINDYDYIVIDNEAGLEHLSRRTTRKADTLLVISDATPVGLRAARRISELVSALKIETKKRVLLVNRCDSEIEKGKIADLGLKYLGCLPHDDNITKISLNGNSLLGLKSDAPLYAALSKLGEQLWRN